MLLVFQPIKIKKIYEEIVEQLKELIRTGNLKPGDKLPSEREMAESMKVSRSSVREALTALEALGILDVHPGEGTFIKQTSKSEIFESLALVLAMERNPSAQLMEVRRILETESAALASLRATEVNLSKIKANLNQMKNAHSIQEAVEYDLKFHFAIAEATQNTILLRIMNTIADLMHNTFFQDRVELFTDSQKGPRILKEHEEIYMAICERNSKKAKLKMLNHINNIETGIKEILLNNQSTKY